eukprot:Phypoly_transcript_17262.p1 GENE.Phypoly_transcript_17262~~Phypoly_transcript_17262.p1  ORF type:complete len:169 (+),score=1.11 Phypoly_transcript_17262:129-635(+)
MGLQYTCTHLTPNLREYKISRHPPPSTFDLFDYSLGALSISCFLYQVIYNRTISFVAIFCTLLIIIHVLFRMNSVVEESLLVIRDTGVQLTKRYFNGRQKHLFIDKTLINAILINEGASRFQFIFYMAFKVQHERRLILAFEDLIPRINVLLQIYQGTRSIIFGEPED